MGIIETIKDAATSTSIQKNINVLGTEAYSGLQSSINQTIDSVKNAAQANVTNLGSNILNVIEGVTSTTQTINNIANALNSNNDSGLGTLISDIGTTIAQFNGENFGPYTPGMGSGQSQNDLANYAAYNYVITLTCGGTKILKSAGEPTDFIIDNLSINSNLALNPTNGNANATSMSFKIIEPYSMGRFFEAIQAAALDAGCANYADVPYELLIEFIGHLDCDTLAVSIAPSKKFKIKIREITMRVDHKGSFYNVEAYRWEEHAFNTSYAEVKTDMSISCNQGGPYTVEDLLIKAEKSLVNQLNLKLKEEKNKQLVNTPNDIKIILPGPVARAALGFDQWKTGEQKFAKDNFTYENGIYKRGNLSIDPKNCEFKFTQGTKIQDIINQVIITSDYSVQAETKGNQKVWNIINPDLQNKGDIDLKTGIPPRTIIYKVEPYVVDTSAHQPVNMGSNDVNIVRNYYYIWTGKNKDILNFEINFNNAFYMALSSDGNKESSARTVMRTGSQGIEKVVPKDVPEPDGVRPPYNPEVIKRDSISTGSRKNGGVPYEDNRSLAGKQFHDMVTRGYDMIQLELTINGDPFYLGGRDNKSIPYEDGEQYITIEFATPIGLGPDCTGFIGTSDATRRFNGLYRVLEVKSDFNKGRFKQVLSCTRKPGQDSGVSGPSATPQQAPIGAPTT